jgi:hypothetical protein
MTRGNQGFAKLAKHGAKRIKDVEDFFASSPTANLVSIAEKDTIGFSKGVKRVLDTFFFILGSVISL